jgi:hypothetical protein
MGERLPGGGEGGAEHQGLFWGVFCTRLDAVGKAGEKRGRLEGSEAAWREGRPGWAEAEPLGSLLGLGTGWRVSAQKPPKRLVCAHKSRVLVFLKGSVVVYVASVWVFLNVRVLVWLCLPTWCGLCLRRCPGASSCVCVSL